MAAAYDSESSDGDYTETNVLLGYTSKEAEEDTISRLGGVPEWLDPEAPPTAALARCKVCKDLMVLLLQLNGELPERFPGHERRIYVFACRRATCRRREGSIRALRGVRVWKDEERSKAREVAQQPEKKEEEKPKDDGPGLGDALFGAKGLGSGPSATNPFSSNANPFSSSSSAQSSNPFSSPSAPSPFAAPQTAASPPAPEIPTAAALSKTFAETLSLNAPPTEPPPPAEPWPADTASFPKPYPTLYLSDAEYETLDDPATSAAAKLPAGTRVEPADAAEPSAVDREAFESTMDAAFQKFADRLAQNPDQAIRYEFAGVPLLYSKTDPVGLALAAAAASGGRASGMPGCANCGAARSFEVQLTPNAIAELEADDASLEGMEWGTVIVGVCEADCAPRQTEKGEAGYLEEWAGVQWEELTKRK